MGTEANTEIAGKLRLVKPLGEGSAGHVWLAKHLDLGSEVAIKFLHRDVAADEVGRERFVREARTVARLRSPHVVQVHDFGFHEERAYLVMEYLIGETLESRLRREGAMPAIDVARICTQIAKALQKAHDAGIVHRDIKPANVFLVDYGDEEIAKVVDFGIVKAIDAANLATSTLDVLTQTGSLLGTPYYMSPEQIEDSGRVAHQSDLWSLGVIAYECLVGKHPFEAPNFAQLVMSICRHPLPVPSASVDVPAAFDAWFAHALDRDPEQRFQSARELARELCHALVFRDSDISMLRGSVPPDLFWSGAHPTCAPVIRSVGSDRPSALDDDVLEDETGASDNDTLVCPPPATDLAHRDVAAMDRIVVLEANLSSTDGSLGSQVAPKPQVPPRRTTAARNALLALGAIVLIGVGWFGNLVSRDGLPDQPSKSDIGSTSAPQAASDGDSRLTSVSSSPTTQPVASNVVAAASALADAPIAAASSSAPVVSPTARKAAKKPPRVQAPATTAADTESPPPPSEDDILGKRQ